MNKDKINLEILKRKSARLIKDFSGYRIKWMGLNLDDAEDFF